MLKKVVAGGEALSSIAVLRHLQASSGISSDNDTQLVTMIPINVMKHFSIL